MLEVNEDIFRENHFQQPKVYTQPNLKIEKFPNIQGFKNFPYCTHSLSDIRVCASVK